MALFIPCDLCSDFNQSQTNIISLWEGNCNKNKNGNKPKLITLVISEGNLTDLLPSQLSQKEQQFSLIKRDRLHLHDVEHLKDILIIIWGVVCSERDLAKEMSEIVLKNHQSSQNTKRGLLLDLGQCPKSMPQVNNKYLKWLRHTSPSFQQRKKI